MTSLLLAEVSRAFARRLVRIVVAFALLICAIGAVIVFVRTEDPQAGSRAAASRYEAAFRECVQVNSTAYAAPPGNGAMPFMPSAQEIEAECRQMAEAVSAPRTFDIMELWGPDGPGPALYVIFFLSFLLSFVVGASLIGAEWRAGTVTTTLLWESRRVRLAIAKFVAAAVTTVTMTIVVSVFLVLALLPTMTLHGSAHVDGAWLGDALRGYAGGLAVVVFWTLIGGAIAMIGRNTAAALAGGFVYSLIVERILEGWRPGWTDWLISPNVGVIMSGTYPNATESVSRSLLVLTVYALVAFAAATLAFRSRDIAGSS